MLLYCWLCQVILKSKNGENTSSVAFHKKLYSNSTIQENRVYFTAPNVVYREVIFPEVFFFVFLLSKPWPLYRIDVSLMQISMAPMYLYVRECTYTLETYNYSTCQVGDKGGGGGFMEPLLQEGQKMLNFAGSPCCSGRYRHEGRHRCWGRPASTAEQKAAAPGLGMRAWPRHRTIAVCLDRDLHTSASGMR